MSSKSARQFQYYKATGEMERTVPNEVPGRRYEYDPETDYMDLITSKGGKARIRSQRKRLEAAKKHNVLHVKYNKNKTAQEKRDERNSIIFHHQALKSDERKLEEKQQRKKVALDAHNRKVKLNQTENNLSATPQTMKIQTRGRANGGFAIKNTRSKVPEVANHFKNLSKQQQLSKEVPYKKRAKVHHANYANQQQLPPKKRKLYYDD
jgi:hypothetical protein